jgi:hypothetical protein
VDLEGIHNIDFSLLELQLALNNIPLRATVRPETERQPLNDIIEAYHNRGNIVRNRRRR